MNLTSITECALERFEEKWGGSLTVYEPHLPSGKRGASTEVKAFLKSSHRDLLIAMRERLSAAHWCEEHQTECDHAVNAEKLDTIASDLDTAITKLTD